MTVVGALQIGTARKYSGNGTRPGVAAEDGFGQHDQRGAADLVLELQDPLERGPGRRSSSA